MGCSGSVIAVLRGEGVARHAIQLVRRVRRRPSADSVPSARLEIRTSNRDRDREEQSLTIFKLLGRDSQDLTTGIDHWAARIAGIDRGVELDERPGITGYLAPQGAHNASRYGVL